MSLKIWDGTDWVKSDDIPSSPGPPAPVAGELLAVQRQYGRGGTGQFIPVHGNVLWANTTGTEFMRLTYTPLVNCWWDVSALVGQITKTDAAYNYHYPCLRLTPADYDGQSICYQYEMAHSSVQWFTFSQFQRIWKLMGGITYTCEVVWFVSAGTWEVGCLSDSLNMQGRAYSR